MFVCHTANPCTRVRFSVRPPKFQSRIDLNGATAALIAPGVYQGGPAHYRGDGFSGMYFDVLALAFVLLIVFLLLARSVFIMTNLNHNMPPMGTVMGMQR